MQGRNKGDVLLTELVIVILFFSLVAVTVVQMFTAARQRSAHSELLERALIAAEDWAERLYSARDPAGMLADAGFAPADGADEDGAVLALADERREGLIVKARVGPESLTEAGRLFSATVSIFSTGREAGDDPLVALPVVLYLPAGEVAP